MPFATPTPVTPPCVLVVDANPSVRRQVSQAFDGTGYAVVGARDATEAQQLADGRDLCVVIASTSLPKGNGYELARALRDRHPAAAVFLLAGGFEVFNQARADEAGVTGCIPKPFSTGGLRARVEEVVGPLPEHAPAPAAPQPARANAPPPPRAVAERWRPLASDERTATLLPRNYREQAPVAVDPDVVGPALERAILEVLPEVVEVVLKRALETSPAFRDLVEVAVDEAVRSQLPDIARGVVRERLAEIEARGLDESE